MDLKLKRVLPVAFSAVLPFALTAYQFFPDGPYNPADPKETAVSGVVDGYVAGGGETPSAAAALEARYFMDAVSESFGLDCTPIQPFVLIIR